MLGLYRRTIPTPSRPQPRSSRPRLEPLEARTTPTDLAVLSARLRTPTEVQFTYAASGDPGAFSVAVYRSKDAVFDPSDRLIAGAVVTPAAEQAGGTASVRLGREMAIDPARPHVLVVADPQRKLAEADERNNAASFRKLTLGAVTHGYQPTGSMPAWVTRVADELRRDGYALAFAHDWARGSALPAPNQTVIAGAALAARVRQAATALATRPNDVVDLHLVGHSRGTVVISQASLSLGNNPGPAALRLGFTEMSILDPHPARNRGLLNQGLAELSNGTGVSHVGGFSFNPASWLARTVAAATLRFQEGAIDPEVVIGRNVDAATVYRQELPWQLGGTTERLSGVNIWAAPLPVVLNPYRSPVRVVDVGLFGIAHTGVSTWFLDTLLR